MLNLNDFQVFVQVVDHGGFAAASRRLNVPKSTLSKRVLELERMAGVRLIHRTSRSFAVTELGREFYRHAAAMLVEAEAAENVIRGRLAEPSGTVRITASVPTAQISLAGLLPRIAGAHPRIRIELHATDRFVDIVRDGFDIAIRDHFGPLSDSGLVQRRIGFEHGWLVASPDYAGKVGNPSDPSEVAAMDGLMVSSAEAGWRLTDAGGRTVEVSPVPRFHADESVVLMEAARAGLGVACLPAKLCGPRIRAGELVRLLPSWTAGGVTTTLLMPHRRGLLPSVRVVADLLVGHLSRRPPESGT